MSYLRKGLRSGTCQFWWLHSFRQLWGTWKFAPSAWTPCQRSWWPWSACWLHTGCWWAHRAPKHTHRSLSACCKHYKTAMICRDNCTYSNPTLTHPSLSQFWKPVLSGWGRPIPEPHWATIQSTNLSSSSGSYFLSILLWTSRLRP